MPLELLEQSFLRYIFCYAALQPLDVRVMPVSDRYAPIHVLHHAVQILHHSFRRSSHSSLRSETIMVRRQAGRSRAFLEQQQQNVWRMEDPLEWPPHVQFETLQMHPKQAQLLACVSKPVHKQICGLSCVFPTLDRGLLRTVCQRSGPGHYMEILQTAPTCQVIVSSRLLQTCRPLTFSFKDAGASPSNDCCHDGASHVTSAT